MQEEYFIESILKPAFKKKLHHNTVLNIIASEYILPYMIFIINGVRMQPIIVMAKFNIIILYTIF